MRGEILMKLENIYEIAKKIGVDETYIEPYGKYKAKIDFEESKKIHPNNRKRVLRAIEIYLSQGEKKSEIIASQEHKLLYDVTFVGLTKSRESLYRLINKRVDQMFERGLVDEVKDLMNRYDTSLRAFQAIGYKELIEGLSNNQDLEEIKDLIKRN